MRRRLNKIRIAILKTITAVAVFGFIVSGCALDSESNIPINICGICLAWLVLMTIANREEY